MVLPQKSRRIDWLPTPSVIKRKYLLGKNTSHLPPCSAHVCVSQRRFVHLLGNLLVFGLVSFSLEHRYAIGDSSM